MLAVFQMALCPVGTIVNFFIYRLVILSEAKQAKERQARKILFQIFHRWRTAETKV